MYESPVHLILQDVESQIDQEIEQAIITVVRKFDISVDKGELIKALRYDRNQYEKGYENGVNNTLDKIRTEIKALSPEPTAYDVVDGNPVKDAIWKTLIEVDKIIDKYKTESEKS